MGDDQVIIIDKKRDYKGKEPTNANIVVDGIMSVMEKMVANADKFAPYLGAFGLGAIVGLTNEGDALGSLRVGFEGMLYMTCIMQPQPSGVTISAPSAVQIFGLAGLGGILLSVPANSIIKEIEKKINLGEIKLNLPEDPTPAQYQQALKDVVFANWGEIIPAVRTAIEKLLTYKGKLPVTTTEVDDMNEKYKIFPGEF